MKKHLSLFLCLLFLLSLLAGCGASSSTAADQGYAMEAAEAEAPMAMADSASGAGLTNSSGSPLPAGRKWIVTVDLSAETEDLDTLQSALDAQIASCNGYVEDQSLHNGSSYNGTRRRSASLTIRIPAEQVDVFLQDVGSIANIVRQNKTVEDITLSYVATESRLKALETEETRLLELLAKAENMSDLLEIEARLSDVRYELENIASQKRLYDNQVDYATIYLNISEVREYTPVEEPSLWQRISKGFTANLKGVGEDILDVIVWFIVSLPYLVVFAIAIVVFLLITRPLRRRRAAKKAKKQQETKE